MKRSQDPNKPTDPLQEHSCGIHVIKLDLIETRRALETAGNFITFTGPFRRDINSLFTVLAALATQHSLVALLAGGN